MLSNLTVMWWTRTTKRISIFQVSHKWHEGDTYVDSRGSTLPWTFWLDYSDFVASKKAFFSSVFNARDILQWDGLASASPLLATASLSSSGRFCGWAFFAGVLPFTTTLVGPFSSALFGDGRCWISLDKASTTSGKLSLPTDVRISTPASISVCARSSWPAAARGEKKNFSYFQWSLEAYQLKSHLWRRSTILPWCSGTRLSSSCWSCRL